MTHIDRSKLRVLLAVQGMSRGMQRIKLEPLVAALRRIYPRLEVCDAEPDGWRRFAGLIATFRPNREMWKQSYYADPLTFDLRTATFCSRLRNTESPVDVILQVGVLFDATACAQSVPVIVYTDYVVTLTVAAGKMFRMQLSEAKIEKRIAQEAKVFSRAVCISTRSRAVANAVIEQYGISPLKVTAAGGGGNIVPGVRSNDHAAAGSQPGTRFIFVGREFYRKGGDLVLEAFKRVRKTFPDASLTMVTSPDNQVKVENVTWVGEISQHLLAEAYGNSDVFVLASRFETWGDVVIEAMSAGLACICPNISPIDEIVMHGETGLLVDMMSNDALAEAMTRLAADRIVSSSMGASGRARANTEFTWDVTAQRLAERLDAAAEIIREERKESNAD